MIAGIPKISVLIICYNQESLIGRALDSLLSQKDYVYEICVSDDCSPDNTWQVLLNYQKQYPDMIKLHRNEPNVGIFENIEYSWAMPTGDIIYQMAGDDECYEGWFKRVCDYIEEKSIDYKNELFCIYGDYQVRYPNGDAASIRNNHVLHSKVSLFSLALRHVIENRSSCFSMGVLKKFRNVSDGRSHQSEEIQARQLQIFSEKNYYINAIGNTYYANIGVSAHIDQKTHDERQQLADYTIEKASEMGYEISGRDKNYLYFTRALFQAKHTGKWSDYHKAFVLFIKSYEPRIGLKGLRFKRILFALRRRLPHRKPIRMTV